MKKFYDTTNQISNKKKKEEEEPSSLAVLNSQKGQLREYQTCSQKEFN